MPNQNFHPFTKPFYIFFLVFPSGISQGFVSVALPYFLVNSGFSVAQSAGIVAVGFSANLWRFIWGPVVDLSLSLKKWYWIGLLICTGTLLLLCVTPLTVNGAVWLTVVVFVSQVACTFLLLPVTGFMAHSIEPNKKGKAAGWFQAGSLAGVGFGGGAGLWLGTHYSIVVAGVILTVISVVFALAILLIKDVQHSKQKPILQEIMAMGKDIITMLKIPVVLFAIILITMPIGTGAAANLWSAIAKDWKVNADTVALVTGILSGLISAVGCVVGGFFADRKGIWFAYLGSGSICAFITLVMAAMPYQPVVYIVGVLAYTFGIGLINAAFTSVLLFAAGKRNAATKYSLLSSLGNLPVVYMTAIDGFTHDRYSSKYMLATEAILGIAFVVICILVLSQMKRNKLLLRTID
jgi:MFS transporter, PAT family, beta-lactamase induction signal transducer AmpG